MACIWWDRKPVYYLCMGDVAKPSMTERKLKRVGAPQVLCPSAVNDYQDWIGDVDRHDQIRLYLLLGVLDVVLVNAYLSQKEGAKIKQSVPMKRSEWFATPPPSGQGRKRASARLIHAVQQSEDWVTVSNVQKRRQLSCKLCALLRTEKKKSYATTYYCERCSGDSVKC
ncbi:Hypothetical protein PHPALM_14009 [Phytophthora palmivora]|uniref:PiggyBac transposable element-derived protein domain-containing protein n=1 Tax=Phytophthora palmivora TaxID=4796 RepID=A0A2P4XVV3_9STRA|nr:Hypothetical protein PHPALM_14009 [Phytophthora palmivora]